MVIDALAPILTGAHARQGVEVLLERIAGWERHHAFANIGKFLPALFQLEGEAGMAEIYRAFRDVEQWFP